jgi:hypothetical protein
MRDLLFLDRIKKQRFFILSRISGLAQPQLKTCYFLYIYHLLADAKYIRNSRFSVTVMREIAGFQLWNFMSGSAIVDLHSETI